MATFNWSPNPYFTPNAYVSHGGSDGVGDGSANNPYRTIQKALDNNKTMVHVAAHTIRTGWTNAINASIYFEPGTVLDFFNVTLSSTFTVGSVKLKSFVHWGSGMNNLSMQKCFITNGLGSSIQNVGNKIFNVIKSDGLSPFGLLNHSSSGQIRNNTFVFQTINFSSNASGISTQVYPAGCNCNILLNCDILCSYALPLQAESCGYNLFFNCRYKFANDASFYTLPQLEAIYGVAGIHAIRAYYSAKFGAFNAFPYSLVADPLFNNSALDDYTLNPLSPARHMAYDGTYIGAKDVGFPTYAYANDLGYPNAFYNASKHANVVVGNNSITLARNPDGSAVGSGYITEKPKKLGQIYELKGNGSSYMGADRNREMLDVNSDIGDLASPISAGTPLTSGVIYINEGGSVVYNGTTHANRSRITAVDSVQSFTTTEGAVLHAVTEYPNRYTNLIRHKQTIPGTQIAAGTDVLTADSWYRVLTSSITWDGKTIPVDDCFQAVAGKWTFTGTGVCVAEFSAADVWSECIIDAPIKCRRVGNVASGAIDVGADGKPLTNGHKEYYNATNKVRAEFSILAAYVQKHWVLNAKMSK